MGAVDSLLREKALEPQRSQKTPKARLKIGPKKGRSLLAKILAWSELIWRCEARKA